MLAASPASVPPDVVMDSHDLPHDGRIGSRELAIIGGGTLAAVLVYIMPLVGSLLRSLVTLFHEVGHAVAGWLLGYPSVPAFDLVYGGGFTHQGTWRIAIVLLLAGGFAYLLWLFRENRRAVVLIVSVMVVWLFFVSAEWRRELLIGAAGHLSEFILAAIFFYKALSGTGLRNPEIERPVAAFIAAFVTINSVGFAQRLRSDAEFVAWYREGKGGMLMNDLESVALDLKIHFGWDMTVERVATWLLIFSVLPFVTALIWYFERSRWHRLLRSLTVAGS